MVMGTSPFFAIFGDLDKCMWHSVVPGVAHRAQGLPVFRAVATHLIGGRPRYVRDGTSTPFFDDDIRTFLLV
jgi:hypothetical protein